MMRVGIVTLPFHFNYGGILQAFALQKAIQNLGFEPIIIEQPSNNIKQVLKQKLYKRSNIYKFVKENFNLLKLHEPFCDDELSINNINILVVGSDQFLQIVFLKLHMLLLLALTIGILQT